MTRERWGPSERMGDEYAPGERVELHAAAAGVVAGLGAFFVVSHLAGGGDGLVRATLYDVPFIVLSVSLLYAGYWLLACDVGPRRVSRIAMWSLAGFLVLLAVGVWASGGRAADVQSAAEFAVDVGTVGATTGLLVGLEGERRLRKQGRDAHVAVQRAEGQFAFFNRLLRHHLLNGLAVVRGHAELLAEVYDDPPEAVDVINRRCDEIVELVRNVELLSRAFTGDLTVEAVDPTLPLVHAVESARTAGADVEVHCAHRDGSRVLANDRIGLVFGAVLDAAVESADGGRVTVETAERGEEFVVSIAFDGSHSPGFDAAVRPGEHGDEDLEVFLAETLLEYFGGSLDLPAGGAGSALALRLLLVD